MGVRVTLILLITACLFALAGCPHGHERNPSKRTFLWEVHDQDRPQPPVVTPGETVGQPPSHAIVLFDGSDLSQWKSDKGGPAQWKVQDGYMQVVKGTGSIYTKQSFGDCQLHIEWAAPDRLLSAGQFTGNSGVFFMGRYEVQVLDSYQNKTYPDGQAAAVYGQYPPLFNACRPSGQWQVYDIIFRSPRFGEKGDLLEPARVTVFHNGVCVQNHVEILGATTHKKRAQYHAHPDKLPLLLQDHLNPVRFRNIWLIELPETPKP